MGDDTIVAGSGDNIIDVSGGNNWINFGGGNHWDDNYATGVLRGIVEIDPQHMTFVKQGETTLRDLNGDGRSDLVQIATDASGDVTAMRARLSKADGTFEAVAFDAVSVNGQLVLGDLVSADVNGDGIKDTIFRDTTNRVTVSRGKPGGGFEAGTSSPLMVSSDGDSPSWNTFGNFRMLIGDINGDGRADLLAEYEGGANDRRIWTRMGQADGTFGDFLINEHNYPGSIYGGNGEATLSDINGDGRVDLVRSTYDTAGQLTGQKVLLANTDGSFAGGDYGVPTVVRDGHRYMVTPSAMTWTQAEAWEIGRAHV